METILMSWNDTIIWWVVAWSQKDWVYHIWLCRCQNFHSKNLLKQALCYHLFHDFLNYVICYIDNYTLLIVCSVNYNIGGSFISLQYKTYCHINFSNFYHFITPYFCLIRLAIITLKECSNFKLTPLHSMSHWTHHIMLILWGNCMYTLFS
jgi:hypothetical protein